jgi:hypothetical protein
MREEVPAVAAAIAVLLTSLPAEGLPKAGGRRGDLTGVRRDQSKGRPSPTAAALIGIARSETFSQPSHAQFHIVGPVPGPELISCCDQ